MKTILLTASTYARIEEIEFKFEFEHVRRILSGIIINDPKKRALIYETFEYEHEEFKELTEDSYKNLDSSAMGSMHENVIQALSNLKEDGVDIFSDRGISLYQGELPDNYQQDIKIEPVPKKPAKLLTNDERNLVIQPVKGFRFLDEIDDLKETLNSTVLSQKYAVDSICDTLIKNQFKPNKKLPKGIFFFVGPPATGKTFLAQTLEKNLNDFTATKVIDMTQYTHSESGGGLYGAAQHWGNAYPGTLTRFVKENPKSIIILDEFEKANNTVQSNLLSILSEGYLDDACGWFKDGKVWTSDRAQKDNKEEAEMRVDFSQTIIIFTSNLGKEVYENQALIHKLKDNPQELEQVIYESISREQKSSRDGDVPAITPEFLSRLRQGSMALFNKLSFQDLRKIAFLGFEKEKMAFESNYKLKINSAESLINPLLLSFAPNFDVREIKVRIAKHVIDTITQHYMRTKQTVKRVDFKLDKEMKERLKLILQDPEGFMKECKRKNKRVTFETQVTNLNETLTIAFSEFGLKTLSRAKDFQQGGISIEVPNINFSDIAGHTMVKEKLQEVVELFKHYEEVQKLGVNVSKGILLYGPPGTGKTIMAKALANEADLPFISTTGEKLLHPDEIKKVFDMAREYAPSIIFVDEIDAFSKRNQNSDAMDIAVNRLLTNIDGFNTTNEDPVYIIAATNLKEKIDPALLRSGRIDMHIEVGSLDYEAREYFLKKMLKNSVFGKDIDSHQITKYSAGLNGSDLEKIERELILDAYKHVKKEVSHEDILEQVNTVKYGRRIDRKKLDRVLEATAYHEAGHAILAKILTPLNRIEQVTVMPRANALGFVSFAMETDEHNSNDLEYMKNQIYVLLAGRVAQEQRFKSLGTDAGASSDLQKANKLVYLAITRYGMDEELKNINTSMFDTNTSAFSNELIFKRQEIWVQKATEKTEALVQKHWKSIDSLAKALMKEEFIDGRFLDDYLQEPQQQKAITCSKPKQPSLFDGGQI